MRAYQVIQKKLLVMTIVFLMSIGVVGTVQAQTQLPHLLENGNVADANQVMANFNALLDAVNALVPAGTVLAFAGETAPAGFYECNGQEISRTDHPALFAVISTIYGAGDGSDTFNVPDYRGYFLRGTDKGSGVDVDSANRTDRGDGQIGDLVGTKQEDEVKAHQHDAGIRSCAGAGGDIGMRRGWSHSSCSQWLSTATGGEESRPKNINVTYIIKY